MEIDEDKKIAKILKKANKNKPQFGLATVPTYGKDRSGKEYGGFIKEATYNKMKYRGSKSKSRLLFPDPKMNTKNI